MYHSPVTNALWEARSHIFEKLGDTVGEDTTSQTGLDLKTPSQSRTSILYSFSSDFKLREQYRNPWNAIRTGKLLEDLDALAGTIAFKVYILTLSLLELCYILKFLSFFVFCFMHVGLGLVANARNKLNLQLSL